MFSFVLLFSSRFYFLSNFVPLIFFFCLSVKFADNSQVKRIASDVTKAVVGRAFACKNISQSKGHDVILTMMESDDSITTIVEALLDGTSNTKPKVPPECVKCIQYAYIKIGAKAMPNQQIIKKLKDLFEVRVFFLLL